MRQKSLETCDEDINNIMSNFSLLLIFQCIFKSVGYTRKRLSTSSRRHVHTSRDIYLMIVHRLLRLQQNWGNVFSLWQREERLYFFLSSNGPQMSRLLRHTDAPTSVTTCARVER
ncbi:hypothetical protein TNCV_2003941 [Trichonephila clavipes]|nr:hypothetical protein TNCV_2003941 [Trichonephila clavipes]